MTLRRVVQETWWAALFAGAMLGLVVVLAGVLLLYGLDRLVGGRLG